MATTDNNTDATAALRYIFVILPRCPKCRSDQLEVYGHLRTGEGKTQYTRCRECQWKFFTVWEDFIE